MSRGTPSRSGSGSRLARGGGSIVIDANGAIDYNVPAGEAHTFQVNAVDLFTIGPTNVTLASGQMLVPPGTVLLPPMSFDGDPDTGWSSSGNKIRGSFGGAHRVTLQNDRIEVGSAMARSWASGVAPGATDLELFRDGPGILAQRRGTNAQEQRWNETFTDGANFARLANRTAAGDYLITPEAAGTGTLRGLQLVASGGRLGFYGTTAIAQQTGVAVTAAGVHAACVATGLFTA